MSRIDDSLEAVKALENLTERALQLAGLISTLFKIRGISLVVTGPLAYDSYANATSENPELELAASLGKLSPRLLQEIMAGQLQGEGANRNWQVAGVTVHFYEDSARAQRGLCRDFMTDHGVAKLFPAEDITAERILAAVHPAPNPEARAQALQLLINALAEAFHMDWPALRQICHQPEFRVGEELTQLRAEAKREADLQGILRDHVGHSQPLHLETPVERA